MKNVTNGFKRAARNIGISLSLILPAQGYSAPGELATQPLFLGGGDVPGNMVLVPSVEYPTVNSVANLSNNYSSDNTFEGYFDPGKCYVYNYDASSAERHFYPTATTNNRRCTGPGQWSGNYLNWATTQTIDPFRKVLTGGYRYRDTVTETWLEKARQSGEGSLFPDRQVSGSEVAGATPFNSASSVRTRINGLGVQMRFRLDDGSLGDSGTSYNPSSTSTDWNSGAYNVHVRVKVCDPQFPEDNCVAYGSNYKPEGVIQKNAEQIRFSVFGYLNDSDGLRDGGVLRARQKYVGPRRYVEGQGFVDNPRKEWNPSTGVFLQNPDADDAAATHSSIQNSGVINYINKFGQLGTGNLKSIDPVSELYYAATRYLKNQGNVAAYSTMGNADATTAARWRDFFPVIEDWDDPIQYECQPNVLLGIGDANTHRDKNLPGNDAYRSNEPSMPAEVAADNTVNVLTETNRIGGFEGLGDIANTNAFSGRSNSAYLAGLAFHNHTRDMRSDLAGVQTASTYWVDVLENRVLERVARNQYYLATKYGGFVKPEGFDPDTMTGLTLDQWHTNGEILTPNSGSTFPRPDNYFLAGEAAQMIQALESAFEAAGSEISRGSSTSVSFNTTSLETDSLLFGARFDSTNWSGEFFARGLTRDAQGVPSVDSTDIWEAGSLLTNRDLISSPRQIITFNGSEGLPFTTVEFNAFNETQRSDLAYGGDSDLAAERIAYLRGEDIAGMRSRTSRLGDIVNSSPIYVGKPALNWPNGEPFGVSGSTYNGFKASQANRDPVVYVGANDGMLHAFSAVESVADGGGQELFAYIPSFVFSDQVQSGLHYLTDPNYTHKYYVDLTPATSDVYIGGTGGASRAWRTVLIGGSRAGARGLFALDVTNPANFSETNASNMVLWEFTHPDLGYITEPPLIVMAPWGNGDYRWTALVGNGYNSGSGKTGIFMIDLEGGLDGSWTSGTDYRFINFENSGGTGLSAVTAVDLTGNRIIDRIYGGDLKGNMWGAEYSSNSWSSIVRQGSSPRALFTAVRDGIAQPITVPPAVVRSPQPGNEPNLLVLFGTGQYLTSDDPFRTAIQSYYGITDQARRNTTLTRDDLLPRTLSHSDINVDGVAYKVRESSGTEWTSEAGWYVDFDRASDVGERIVQRTRIRGKYAFVNSTIPTSDPCAAGGDGWIMAFGLDGRTPDRAVFTRFGEPVVGYRVEGSMPNVSGFIGDYMITPLSDNTFMEDEIDLGPGGRTGRVSWQEIYD